MKSSVRLIDISLYKRTLLKSIYLNKNKTMKVNNRKEIAIAMYGFFLLLILDILFLVFATKFLILDKATLYGIFLIVFMFSIWRITLLKTFSLEVSEHILSVKYRHPLSANHHPVLEVPLQKVMFYKIERGLMNYIMTININTKRGMKSFYYRLGTLPKSEASKFNKMSDLISYVKTETEL